MNIKQILDSIAALSGKKDKLTELGKHKDNEVLKEVIYKAHSPRIKYYIKQIPEYESQPLNDDSYSLEQMLVKVEAFSSRELTGNAASNYLKAMLENSAPDDAEVIQKIIGKNLKIGMDTGINKVIPNLIEETPYQGAKSFSKKGALKLFKGKVGVRSDVKMDGTYRNSITDNGGVEMCSRQGEISFLTGSPILDELARLEDCVLNGELTIDTEPDRVTANGMINSIMDILKKAEERGEVATAKKKVAFEAKHGSFDVALQNIRFTVWDMLTLDEYFDKKSDTPYETRRYNLARAVEGFKHVSLVESKVVYSFTEAMAHFKATLARGLEGTILKSISAGWKGTGKGYKPTYQVKMKLEMNIDLKIKGFGYGNKGTKNEHVISRLMVESECGLLKTQPAGMKEAMMEYITANQGILLDTVVEIRCCGLSKDSKGNWSCMHPSVVEPRPDKNTCDTLESAKEIERMAMELVDAMGVIVYKVYDKPNHGEIVQTMETFIWVDDLFHEHTIEAGTYANVVNHKYGRISVAIEVNGEEEIFNIEESKLKRKKLLWLDDKRDPNPRDKWLKDWAKEYYFGGEIHWVKTYAQFTQWIEENGFPDKIAFDNDLGEELEGYDCAKWIKEYCLDNDVKFTSEWVIQSSNVCAPDNINTTLNNLVKHQAKPVIQRFCKGCQKDVTKSMFCECGETPLSESSTITREELSEFEDAIDNNHIEPVTSTKVDPKLGF